MVGCLHKLQYEIRNQFPKALELLTAFIYKDMYI
jgi:hypothetical protein